MEIESRKREGGAASKILWKINAANEAKLRYASNSGRISDEPARWTPVF